MKQFTHRRYIPARRRECRNEAVVSAGMDEYDEGIFAGACHGLDTEQRVRLDDVLDRCVVSRRRRLQRCRSVAATRRMSATSS